MYIYNFAPLYNPFWKRETHRDQSRKGENDAEHCCCCWVDLFLPDENDLTVGLDFYNNRQGGPLSPHNQAPGKVPLKRPKDVPYCIQNHQAFV